MKAALLPLLAILVLAGCESKPPAEADCSKMSGIWAQTGSNLRIEIRNSTSGTLTDFWAIKFLGKYVYDDSGASQAITDPNKIHFLTLVCIQDGQQSKLESPQGFRVLFGPSGNLSIQRSEGSSIQPAYAMSGYDQVGN